MGTFSSKNSTVEMKSPDELNQSGFEKRGVTIRLLQAIRDIAVQINPDKDYWSISRISAIVIGNHEILQTESRWGVINPDTTLTYASRASLIEVLRRKYFDSAHPLLGLSYKHAVGNKATFFLSYAYSDNYFDLVAAVKLFLQNNMEFGVDNSYFWFDLFVNDQWSASSKDFNWWSTTFASAIGDFGHTLLFMTPLRNPTLLTRVWCLWEIYCSKREKSNISLLWTPEDLEDLTTRITCRDSVAMEVENLCVFDVKESTCYVADDKTRIFHAIENVAGGLDGINYSIRLLLIQVANDAIRSASSISNVYGEYVRRRDMQWKLVQQSLFGRSIKAISPQYLRNKFDDSQRILDGLCCSELLFSCDVLVGESYAVYRDDIFTFGIVASIGDDFLTVRLEDGVTQNFCLLRRMSNNEIVENAQKNLRCIDWENFSRDLFDVSIRNYGDVNYFYRFSRPVHVNEQVDYFISHTWKDERFADEKYEKLSAVAERFKCKNSRYPTFWFDRCCMDFSDIGQSLCIRPMHVHMCKKMIVLMGATYLSRAWRVLEIIIHEAFRERELFDVYDDIEILLLGNDTTQSDCVLGCLNYDFRHARCFDPNEELKIHRIVDAIGIEKCNSIVKQIGKKYIAFLMI